MSMRIKMLNSSLEELGTIQSVFSSAKREGLNSYKELQFSTYLIPTLSGWIAEGNIAEVEEDYFDIAYFQKDQKEDGSLDVATEFEHVSYRLNNSDYDMEYFTETGTPTEVLTAILDGTGFTVGTVEFTTPVTYSIQEKSSRRKMLSEFVALLGGELDFNKFVISILTQRGSTTPKNITEGRNFSILSVSFDKRMKNGNGDPLISYGCKLINPMEINLGDTVIMNYATLGINATLRVVSISKNPYDPMDVQFEIGNFNPTLENDTYRIETSAVIKDKLYYGARIGPEFGFESVRSDKLARAFFNADAFKMQSGDGTGENWVDRLYFDPVSGKYIFDGTLSATVIEAIKAEIDIIVSNTIIVQNLYAQYGRIANLTVSELNTGWKKIINYLVSDTSDVNYKRDYEQYSKWLTASTDGTQTEQFTDKDNNPLFWVDDTYTGMTLTETDYPVTIYSYTELVKAEISFELDGSTYIPKIILGVGSGVSGHPEYGKSYIWKGTKGIYIDYLHSVTGELRRVMLTDDGIDFSETVNGKVIYKDQTIVEGLVQTFVQDDEPTYAKEKDVWVDTNDYSRYDKQIISTNTTLSVFDPEYVECSGDITVTLFDPTGNSGVIKIIKNVGTNLITVAGTIDNMTNFYLYPRESISLICNGINFREI